MSEDEQQEPMEKYFKEELARRTANDALEDIEITRFLTVYPEITKIFSLPLYDKDGNVQLDPNSKEIITWIPPQYQSLYKAVCLMANQLGRTGNISLKECEFFGIDDDLQMLEFEMIYGVLPPWEKALRSFISMARLDAVEAHRISALTIKKVEAMISGEKKKRKKILGIF